MYVSPIPENPFHNPAFPYTISSLIASGSVYYAGYGIGEEHGLDPRQLSRMRILHNEGNEAGQVTSIHAGLSYLVLQTAAIGKITRHITQID